MLQIICNILKGILDTKRILKGMLKKFFTTADSENLFIEVNVKGKKKGLVFGVVYRHPYHNFSVFQEFCKTLKKLVFLKQDYYIVGDINIDFLKCSNNQKTD